MLRLIHSERETVFHGKFIVDQWKTTPIGDRFEQGNWSHCRFEPVRTPLVRTGANHGKPVRVAWSIEPHMTSLPLYKSCQVRYLFFTSYDLVWSTTNVSESTLHLIARHVFLRLGFMWGAHTHHRSPSWSGFEPTFSRLRAQSSITDLSHYTRVCWILTELHCCQISVWAVSHLPLAIMSSISIASLHNGLWTEHHADRIVLHWLTSFLLI